MLFDFSSEKAADISQTGDREAASKLQHFSFTSTQISRVVSLFC